HGPRWNGDGARQAVHEDTDYSRHATARAREPREPTGLDEDREVLRRSPIRRAAKAAPSRQGHALEAQGFADPRALQSVADGWASQRRQRERREDGEGSEVPGVPRGERAPDAGVADQSGSGSVGGGFDGGVEVFVAGRSLATLSGSAENRERGA